MKQNTTSLLGVSLVVVLSSLATGCDSEAVAARDFSKDRSHHIRHAGCDEVVIPHGFALGWKRYNHRVSQWGVALDHDECAAKEVDITHVGGFFSTNPVIGDEPWARFSYQRARSRGDLAVARVSIRDVVLSDGATTGSAEFDLDELGLGGKRHYVAMIEGLNFDTSIQQTRDYPALYSPDRGYTTRGLGAQVGLEPGGDAVDVNYTIHFETGHTPERYFMNRTLPFARVGAQLDVLIVGTDGPASRADVEYSMKHDRPELFVDVELPAADEADRTVAVVGAPNSSRGFYGLDKFRFALEFESECATADDCTFGTCGDDGRCIYGPKKLGEYVRQFDVGVRMLDFDEETGEAKFVFDGYTSNASKFVAFYPLQYTFEGGVSWVQAGEADEARSLEEWFETGEASFALK